MNENLGLPLPDDESVNSYLRQKLPEWHMRLRGVEEGVKEMAKKHSETCSKIDQLCDAITGTPDGEKRGYNVRLQIVESWKTVVSWAIGVLYAALVTGCVAFVFTKLSK